jgi:hypothetical protein
VHVGIAQHEIGRCAADVCTADHQPEMMRLYVPAARLETVVHRHFATGPVAVQAVLDTFLHRLVQTCMCHCSSDFVVFRRTMRRKPPGKQNLYPASRIGGRKRETAIPATIAA